MTIALYPGSFDPVHNGHVDIATRASKIFDRLIVAVYEQPMKNVLFSIEKRTEMMYQALKHLPNITVTRYGGTTVDFVRGQGAKVIVRGLRMAYDFDIEYQMALTNKTLASDIETTCLFTDLRYAFLSSSIIKQVAMVGGDITHMVPEHVQKALLEKYSSV